MPILKVEMKDGTVFEVPIVDPTLYLQNVVEDLTPESGGEHSFGAHSAGFTLQTATGDGTTTIDWRLGNNFEFTFGAMDETFTFTAPTKVGHLTLILIQDGVGGRTPTLPVPVKWPGNVTPAFSSGANAVDVVTMVWNGTIYRAQIAHNYPA